MSGGEACKCAQRQLPINERKWFVVDRKCNHSAFNGGHRTFSKYSAVRCTECRCWWRTKANYVIKLRDHKGDFS